MNKYLKRIATLLTAGMFLLLLSFNQIKNDPGNAAVKALYLQQLQQLDTALTALKAAAVPGQEAALKDRFSQCRDAYKRVEYAIEYYYPLTAMRMNGPALPESEPGEPAEVILPSGFQVIEADIYGDDATHRLNYINRETDKLRYLTNNLLTLSGSLSFTAADLLDAIRLNLYRLAAKGISGFDSPVALRSLDEGAVTISALADVINALKIMTPDLQETIARTVTAFGVQELTFDHFDRARFFIYCFNPLLDQLHRIQVAKKIPFKTADRAIRANAVSFFSKDAFSVYFFAPPGTGKATPALTSLGKALFSEAALSGGGRSCAGCHDPAKAYTDGLTINKSLQRDEHLSRNTPTLWNAALQPSLFWDSRVTYLEDQVHDVITNKAEMDGNMERIVTLLGQNNAFRKKFEQAFPGNAAPVSTLHITTALAAYIRSLISLDAPFDRYMRGDTLALNKQQVDGFNLFMGKAKCGTCHYVPLFNGAAPPDYTKADGEIIGVPGNNDLTHPVPDKDRGIYSLHLVRHLDGAFKTPGLRHVAATAPYMHNGIYKTLEEVIDFYNRGGGAGSGLTVPNQTLDATPLGLTAAEQAALVSFLKGLGN